MDNSVDNLKKKKLIKDKKNQKQKINYKKKSLILEYITNSAHAYIYARMVHQAQQGAPCALFGALRAWFSKKTKKIKIRG